ncbi:uncharacterized protein LOC124923744 [Impatiens glandulifera]|uniref:uncharacterized protein LOC124923744 n=1 Tax=Impatiens glandulifera TaxID=253017 RepID=UPI001FB19753|nr:uncharacterized protein LOC124923744 [Impatiens glandulifera]
MASTCISRCINDVAQTDPAAVVVRATFKNLYKWPESDAEFLKSVSSNKPHLGQPRVVDSISCRQMYLKSYTFSRDDDHKGPVREIRIRSRSSRRAKTVTASKSFKEASLAALQSAFGRLLSCTTKIDVVS